MWEWYQANKHHFEKEIFPPPMICCFVPDERMSDIVESTMPERTTLLCQSRKDYLELVAHVFGSKDRDIQGMNLPDVTIREYSQHECPELRHQPPGRWSKEQVSFTSIPVTISQVMVDDLLWARRLPKLGL